jgi:WGR domain
MAVLSMSKQEFSRLDVQPGSVRAWCFIREWGRIGRPGQMRVPYPTPTESQASLDTQRRRKSAGICVKGCFVIQLACHGIEIIYHQSFNDRPRFVLRESQWEYTKLLFGRPPA